MEHHRLVLGHRWRFDWRLGWDSAHELDPELYLAQSCCEFLIYKTMLRLPQWSIITVDQRLRGTGTTLKETAWQPALSFLYKHTFAFERYIKWLG